jgi:hypothetical protein
MTAIATFQPEDIVRAWHTFRTFQISLLFSLLDDIQLLQRRITKAKRHLPELRILVSVKRSSSGSPVSRRPFDHSLQRGQRYLDATLVLKYGLDKYQTAARDSSKAGDYEQASC